MFSNSSPYELSITFMTGFSSLKYTDNCQCQTNPTNCSWNQTY